MSLIIGFQSNLIGMAHRSEAMDLTDLRRHHLSLVLDHLVREGPRSRARLAAETSLTKKTISSLVADLLDRELVEELDTPLPGTVGRPGTDVAAAGRTVGGLGLEINIDYVAACVLDLTGDVRVQHRHDGDNRGVPTNRVVQSVRGLARTALDDAERQAICCVGATLALPGLVDPSSGTLFVAPNLHWLGDHGAEPASALRLPGLDRVRADNEANLAAIAELRFGAGQRLSSFVYVSGGIGIGAGVVLDGRLLRGAHGFAGELGHVVVDPEGPQCACGARGCLEVSDRSAAALATALRSVVHLVDPEAIVLGGSFATLGDGYAQDVARRLHRDTLGARWHPSAVVPSSLGRDAALIGAATTVLDEILADPTIVPISTGSTREASA
jgi:predicted NBD/HSP70 family sugar kinase